MNRLAKRISTITSAGLAVAVLSGCGTAELEELSRTEPTGTPFTKTLSSQYLELASYEATQMYDWPDSKRFATKGLQAAKGTNTPPEKLADWRIPRTALSDLTATRTNLMLMLNAGARGTEPWVAATTQAAFDCWVEQQEENWQTAHINACRKRALLGIQALEVTVLPRGKAFFAFDQHEVGPSGRVLLTRLAVTLQMLGYPDIVVAGHTDRAGPKAYNKKLAHKRALAIWRFLKDADVPTNRMAIRAAGEREPAFITADGVRDQRNRRAEITIRLVPVGATAALR